MAKKKSTGKTNPRPNPSMKPKPTEAPVLQFETAKDWREWLTTHHKKSDGMWMKFAKKGSEVTTVTYAQALDEALCFGWIDSQVRPLDKSFYLHKFTPRRARSLWSKVNISHAERLIDAKKMRVAGLQQIERAKTEGRWQKAYDSPSKATVPPEFMKALRKNKKAWAFFKTLNRANLYSIAWRLQTARTEATRLKRIAQIILRLESGQKYHE